VERLWTLLQVIATQKRGDVEEGDVEEEVAEVPLLADSAAACGTSLPSSPESLPSLTELLAGDISGLDGGVKERSSPPIVSTRSPALPSAHLLSSKSPYMVMNRVGAQYPLLAIENENC
jgi:hypothetical protein